MFFFGTTLDSSLSVIPRRIWAMPWHPGRTTIEATWTDGVCRTCRHECQATWDAADVLLHGGDEALVALGGFFVDTDDTRLC